MVETEDKDTVARRWRTRYVILWMVGTGLWIAAMLVTEAAIRPAPTFYVMAPLVFGVPAFSLFAGLAIVQWLAKR